MQNGGSRSNGRISEIDEYLLDPTDEHEQSSVPTENTETNDREEVRRLTALVTHLREQVKEVKSETKSPNGTRSVFHVTATIGLVSVVLISALRMLQARTFNRN